MIFSPFLALWTFLKWAPLLALFALLATVAVIVGLVAIAFAKAYRLIFPHRPPPNPPGV